MKKRKKTVAAVARRAADREREQRADIARGRISAAEERAGAANWHLTETRAKLARLEQTLDDHKEKHQTIIGILENLIRLVKGWK